MNAETKEVLQYLVMILVITLIVVAAYLGYGYLTSLQSCDAYFNTALKDIPVRCIAYWEQRMHQ